MDTNQHPTRPPTNDELSQIIEALKEDTGLIEEELGIFPEEGQTGRDRVTVFSDYVTDSPGYAGPLAVWLWGNGTATTVGFFEDGARVMSEPAHPK